MKGKKGRENQKIGRQRDKNNRKRRTCVREPRDKDEGEVREESGSQKEMTKIGKKEFAEQR